MCSHTPGLHSRSHPGRSHQWTPAAVHSSQAARAAVAATPAWGRHCGRCRARPGRGPRAGYSMKAPRSCSWGGWSRWRAVAAEVRACTQVCGRA
eukprot:15995-Chlamydomonas_euryale.AAC.1